MEFATRHSVNGFTIEVDYRANQSVCFALLNEQGVYQKIFGHLSERGTICFVNFYHNGIIENIESAMNDIKKCIYERGYNENHKPTMHYWQNDVAIPYIDSEKREKLLQREKPKKLRLAKWYEENFENKKPK